MDHLLECAEAFEQLLDVQYHIVLGRKNRLTELTLRFDPFFIPLLMYKRKPHCINKTVLSIFIRFIDLLRFEVSLHNPF